MPGLAAVVALPDESGAIAVAREDVPVHAVVRHVELPLPEPLDLDGPFAHVEVGVARPREVLEPGQPLARLAAQNTSEVSAPTLRA